MLSLDVAVKEVRQAMSNTQRVYLLRGTGLLSSPHTVMQPHGTALAQEADGFTCHAWL